MRDPFNWLVAVCAAAVAADLLIHKHAAFAFEGWFAFHAWYGFVGIVFLVLGARVLRAIVMRPEDHYER